MQQNVCKMNVIQSVQAASQWVLCFSGSCLFVFWVFGK